MSDVSPSPQTTLGILLGASEWPHSKLPSSPAFARSAYRVREYFLYSGHFGFRPENWLDLFDRKQSSPYEVDQAIETFLQERISLMKEAGTPASDLLFYYIGHGMFAFGPDQAYHLAIRSTNVERIRSSAIAMAALAETLKTNARHLRRFVILDCCFAAESLRYMMQSEPDQTALKQTISAFEEKSTGIGFPKKGTALLCSSGHKEASLILPDESGTMFSEAFVRALYQGNTRQWEKTYLSLYDLKTVIEEVLEKLAERNAPRPFVSSPDQSDGDVASVPFFPNPRAEEERMRIAEEEQVRKAREEQARQAEEERRRLAEEAERTRRMEEEKQRRIEEERARQAEEERVRKAWEEEQASQLKQPEPEPEPAPVAPVSETTETHQSQQPIEMATPVPAIPSSQQPVSEVSADIPAQSHTILPLSGRERLPQAEEERRQAEETIVPSIATPESTPVPATFALKATPAPPIPEPLSATEAASSPPTSPDVPSISSSAPPVVPLKRGISRSNKLLIIGLPLVLVLLFGIIGGVIYAANTINRATATDAINSTIAQTNARNIAQLDPALAASNPDPYPPTNGKLTLYDPMHDNTNQGFGWEEDNYCKFTGTAYQVNSSCSAKNLELNNFAFEITVDFTQTGPLQSAEVDFRFASSPVNWYEFTIYNDGYYDFIAVAHNLFGSLVHPIQTQRIRSDALHVGSTNIIAIVAIGSTIDLYANHVKINSFKDDSSNYGGIDLLSVPALFSNAKLWTF